MARARLSRRAVVDLALAVVDDGGARGFDDLTLAAVAGRAGVAVPSLYKHVGGLGDLRREVALVAVRELTEVLREAHAGAQRAPGAFAMTEVGHAVRRWARRTPGRYAATQVAARRDDPADAELGAAGAEAVAVLADALRPTRSANGDAAGPEPTGPDLVHTVRAFRAAVHGFVLLELGGGFGLPDDVDESFDHLLATLGRTRT